MSSSKVVCIAVSYTALCKFKCYLSVKIFCMPFTVISNIYFLCLLSNLKLYKLYMIWSKNDNGCNIVCLRNFNLKVIRVIHGLCEYKDNFQKWVGKCFSTCACVYKLMYCVVVSAGQIPLLL